MKYLVENEIIPKVVKEYERPYIIHKTILTRTGRKLDFRRIEGKTAFRNFKLAYLPSRKSSFAYFGWEQTRITGNGYRRIRGFSEPDY
jgi:hypothetical protein